jgi:hypothetical protein
MGLKIAGYSVCAVTSESVRLDLLSHLLFFFVFSAPRPISKGRISVQKEYIFFFFKIIFEISTSK